MTALEVIIAAYQELGIVVSGGSPNANDAAWSLGKLNRMLKSWSANGLTLPFKIEESFSLTSGTASYEIGSGAVFDTARPETIDVAFIRDSGHDYPIGIRPVDEYWSIPEKASQDRPVRLYYDFTYPNGTIYLYPTPNASDDLHLLSEKPLTTYISTATEVSLPGAYEDALILNLAVSMATRYGKEVPFGLKASAHEAITDIKVVNLCNRAQGVDLRIPGTVRSVYNIDSDY